MWDRPEATGTAAVAKQPVALFSGRPSPTHMDALNRNDVLASNLLFSVLAISLLEQLAAAYLRNIYVYTPTQTISLAGPTDWLVTATVWTPLLLGMLLAGLWYYLVRKGKLWAKIIVLVLFLWNAYSSTSIQDGVLLGVSLNHLLSWALLAWLKAALTITALVLMFRKPRVAPA